MLQGRLQQTESDGIAVAEVIRSLPSDPNYRHNDFSHLGIHAPSRQRQSEMGATGGMSMSWVRICYHIPLSEIYILYGCFVHV